MSPAQTEFAVGEHVHVRHNRGWIPGTVIGTVRQAARVRLKCGPVVVVVPEDLSFSDLHSEVAASDYDTDERKSLAVGALVLVRDDEGWQPGRVIGIEQRVKVMFFDRVALASTDSVCHAGATPDPAAMSGEAPCPACPSQPAADGDDLEPDPGSKIRGAVD